MGKLLGAIFIVFAVLSLIFFSALDPDNNNDEQEDNQFLEPRGNAGSTYDHERYANQGDEIRLTFFSDNAPIRVVVRNEDNGNENVLTEESEQGEFEHYCDNDGTYVVRFENRQDRGTNVQFTTSIRNNDNEAPRAICGILTIVFLVLGIIFFARKSGRKGPVVIQARQMLHPLLPSQPQQGPRSKRSGDLTPRSPFAPPSSESNSDTPSDERSLSDPSGDRGGSISSSTTARTGPETHDGLGYHRSKKPPPAFPMPKDTSKHESNFRCPDCGTVIFINRKIKKVKCPKCSHTFKVE